MKRLPKGMKRINKEEFTNEILLYQEEKNIPFAFEKKEYVDWAQKKQEKCTKKTYRW